MRRFIDRLTNSIQKRINALIEKLPWVNPKPEPDFPEGIIFLHADVRNWKATAKLERVEIDSRTINMPYDKARVWPVGRYDAANGPDVVGNPWVIAKIDNQWYAATWEWLRPGQTSKAKAALEPGHIKRREFDNWMPKQGEKLGFFISGMARSAHRNVEERSNVVWVEWK